MKKERAKPHISKIKSTAYLKSDDMSQDSLISKSGKMFSINFLQGHIQKPVIEASLPKLNLIKIMM